MNNTNYKSPLRIWVNNSHYKKIKAMIIDDNTTLRIYMDYSDRDKSNTCSYEWIIKLKD